MMLRRKLDNLTFLILLIITISYRAVCWEEQKTPKCQEITISMCKNIGYNMTSFPSPLNHETQEEAGLIAHQFWPLVEIKCSADLQFLLCSVYTPICLPDYPKPLPPCRSVCERAKHGCNRILTTHGFAWPEALDCEKFPYFGKADQLCMDYNQTEHQNQHSIVVTTTAQPKVNTRIVSPGVSVNSDDYDSTFQRPTAKASCNCSCSNSANFRPVHTVSSAINNVPYCTYSCKAASFVEGKDNQHFLQFWIGLWAVLCAFTTFVTLLTFFIDMDRFKYPERPIIFLAASYFLVSMGYIVRLASGHEYIACDHDRIRAGTTGPAQCTVVFLLIYFFGISSATWWVILSLAWFLSAGLKWSHEAIVNYHQYFHIVGWGAPAILTVAILALSAVDGDSYSGICYVGNTDTTALMVFVVIPLFVCLLVGSLFLFFGFISLVRIHNIMKHQENGSKIDRLEKLIARIGIFSVLYTIPASIVIGCHFYEYYYRSSWDAYQLCTRACKLPEAKPDFSVFVIKYFMSLIIGVTSGIWIWSQKTVESWRRFLCKFFCCRHPQPAYMPAEAIIVKSHTDLSSAYGRQQYQPIVKHF